MALSQANTPIGSKLLANLLQHLDEETSKSPLPSAEVLEKVHTFRHIILNPNENSLLKLQSLAKSGLPDQYTGMRIITWKILLGYLSPDPSTWDSTMTKSNTEYRGYRDDLVNDLIQAEKLEKNAPPPLDPLKKAPAPVLSSAQLQAKSSLDQINKDAFRTRPEMGFFYLPLVYPKSAQSANAYRTHLWVHNAVPLSGMTRDGLQTAEGQFGNKPGPTDGFQETDVGCPSIMYDIMGRILYIYARLNPGVLYVQGMNELLAPLLYLAFIDPCLKLHQNNPLSSSNLDPMEVAESIAQAEADAFFMFTNLMTDQRDLFCKALDASASGVQGRLSDVSRALARLSPEVSKRLESQQLDLVYFALRWTMLLFAQDFEIVDVIRLWDALFADHSAVLLHERALAETHSPKSYKYIMEQRKENGTMVQSRLSVYICVAMVLRLKDAILTGDFATNLKLLQRFPTLEVSTLITNANALMAEDLAILTRKTNGGKVASNNKVVGALQKLRGVGGNGPAVVQQEVVMMGDGIESRGFDLDDDSSWFEREMKHAEDNPLVALRKNQLNNGDGFYGNGIRHTAADLGRQLMAAAKEGVESDAVKHAWGNAKSTASVVGAKAYSWVSNIANIGTDSGNNSRVDRSNTMDRDQNRIEL